ncbi:MAG: hypothetical protein CME62_15490 [Halobacteriovoraceae bacterium]|nr:hypothetical protein [Halobacteriovoraceae bacterium]|tara:strand:+ start:19478 stop:20179 length:702 start_codon:yes stop_codon:yes gene_type:complete
MTWLKQSLTLFLFFALGSSVQAQSQSVTASPTPVQITELERYGYRVNATEEELNQARQKIRAAANIPNGQSCGFDQEISENRTIGHYDSVIQEMTPFMLQNFSQDCVEELLSQYKATKYQHRTYLIDSVPCRDSENTLQHRDQRCPLIVQYRNNFQIIQQRLKDALINPTEQNRVCSEESLETDLTTLQLSQQILAVLGEHEQNTECSELDVGQSDLRNNGLYNSYLLERKSP